jgi:hypothetical protein
MEVRLAFNLGANVSVTKITNTCSGGFFRSDFSEIEKLFLSMQIGAGYDIPLSSDSNKKHNLFYLLLLFSVPTLFWSKLMIYRNMEQHYTRAGVALKWSDKISKSEATDMVKTVRLILQIRLAMFKVKKE